MSSYGWETLGPWREHFQGGACSLAHRSMLSTSWTLSLVPFPKLLWCFFCLVGWGKHQLCSLTVPWEIMVSGQCCTLRHLVLITTAPLSTAAFRSQYSLGINYFSLHCCPFPPWCHQVDMKVQGPHFQEALMKIRRKGERWRKQDWMWPCHRCPSQASGWRLQLASDSDPMCQCLFLCWNKLKWVATAARLQITVWRADV